MAVAETKNSGERNKKIVAIVLGSLALISLVYMFFGSSSSSGPTKNTNGNTSGATAKTSPTPRSGKALPQGDVTEEELAVLRPLEFPGNPPSIPEAGRNIFAFYVPPPPTPKPVIIPTPIPTPTPVPPNVILSAVSPVNVYAHTGDFTLDVTGDKFTPETKIFIAGAQLQTRFVSPQQLSTKVPAQLISFEGPRDIKVQSPDGKLFSNSATLNVMPAPVPNYSFIGVLNRTGSNDTAMLKEKNGKDILNVKRGDPVGGRFRVTSISMREVVLTDTALKIKHTLPFASDSQNPGAGGQPRYTPPPPPADDDGEP